MAHNTRRVAASPSDVYAVLADGWTYASWVVGTARIRRVDAQWPGPGSVIEHSVGAWPVLLHDRTEAVETEPDRRLVLRVRGWPLGEAMVELTVTPESSGPGCVVGLRETPKAGPIRRLLKPVTDALLRRRNRETLERLAALAERRTD